MLSVVNSFSLLPAFPKGICCLRPFVLVLSHWKGLAFQGSFGFRIHLIKFLGDQIEMEHTQLNLSTPQKPELPLQPFAFPTVTFCCCKGHFFQALGDCGLGSQPIGVLLLNIGIFAKCADLQRDMWKTYPKYTRTKHQGYEPIHHSCCSIMWLSMGPSLCSIHKSNVKSSWSYINILCNRKKYVSKSCL